MKTEKKSVPVWVCAGLLIAPVAWAVSTQLGQLLPYLDCQHQARFSAIVSFAGALGACVAGAISWRSSDPAERPRPAVAFFGSVSALSASVFAFALALQGIASLVLSGCER
jgi:hypothetical protein